MESVLGRYRNLILLVGVLFLQVLGLAVQVKRSNVSGNGEEKDTRLIRIWAVGAVSPFERGLLWIQNGVGNVWHNYFYLRGVRAENRQLKDEIQQMRLEQVRLNEDAAQAHRLQNLLAFKEQFIAKTVAAQVIGSSGSDLSRVIYIDKGERAGIKRDMAVITADGIVGKVLLVYLGESQVLLINDQSSGVGAILEKSRLQGVLRGTANGEVVLERVMSDEQVDSGERVLTSGGDRIFPKGLAIGTVTKVSNGKDLFLNIKIKPATDLSRLEEVLVLVEEQEKQPVAEDNVRVRAADILARRLPSVPDRPATAATQGTTPGTVTKPASTSGAAKPAGTAATNSATGTKPAGTAASNSSGTAKPTSPAGTNSAGASKAAAANSSPPITAVPTGTAPVTSVAPKPKATKTSQTESNPAIEQEKPSIVEEKPAQPPDSPVPQDNSPQ